MFGFGDEPQVFVVVDARRLPGSGEFVEILPVDDQQFVLVELHFQGNARVENGDAGAAVVQQQVFELAQGAFEHGQVDVFAVQIVVSALLAVVAGFEHHVDLIAQRIEQLEEQIEQCLLRDAAAISTGISTPVSLSL